MGLGSLTDSGKSNPSINGLKLGRVAQLENAGASGSSGAPARKVQQQPPRCQVEGCRVDLSDAKAYYSRHKVCAMHSKSSTVIVAGLQQRFCQQCSRFHQLPEFDQEKRSCRRRLAGHNERRRKPPQGSMLHSRNRLLYSTIFGNSSRTRGFLVDFSAYSRYNVRDAWQALRMSQRGPTNQTTAAGWSIAIPSGECFSVADSSCALSLLSSQASELGVPNAHGPPMAQLTAHHAADVHRFPNRNWGFRGSSEGGSSLHEMNPNLGLGQITEPVNNQYSRELEFSQQNAIENSRAYDSSTQGMHWSL